MTTLIVSTDGSDLAIEAARAGLAVTAPADRIVIAVVVEEVDPSLAYDGSGHAGPTMSPVEVDEMRAEVMAAGDEALARTQEGLADLLEGVTVDSRRAEGRPGEALCDLAAELGADAIVMGSRGRGGLKRALLGSVSDHVVRHAPCPVVITGPKADD